MSYVPAISLGSLGLLGMLLIGMAWSAHRSHQEAIWRRRSNARVIKEVQRISRHEPEKIIEQQGEP